MLNYYPDNELCEICIANNSIGFLQPTSYLLWINYHCIALRRNRKARKNKNYKPTNTVF